VKSREIWGRLAWSWASFGPGQAERAARWAVEEMRAREAYFLTYSGQSHEQSAVAVKFTGSLVGLALCSAEPSFAVASTSAGTLHAAWLLTQRVRKPEGMALAGMIARRLGGRPTPLIPVPGTADYELVTVAGALYDFGGLEGTIKKQGDLSAGRGRG
jgi:hypothetical protein